MLSSHFDDAIESIQRQNARYRPGAYEFVMEALAYTQKRFKANKHVTGEQLVVGLRELLIKEFGPMTMTVLGHWGIKSTDDFGNIVMALVDNEILIKTEQDNIDAFRNAYDFDEVFNKGYRRQLHRKISRMRY